jgi:hypothetical protein
MKKNKKNFIVVILVFVTAVVGGYFIAEQNKQKRIMQENVQEVKLPPGEFLVETRPVLSPAIFSGKANAAYQMAAEIPWIIDKQFCYCYCKKNFDHKTLLTCFTSDHGVECDLCMDEVFESYRLYKKGLSSDQIVAAIEKKFRRQEHEHEHQED